ASLPLPSLAEGAAPARAEAWPLSILDEHGLPAAGASLLDVDWIGSARLQLAYPWVQTAASAAMPEGVEGAEGVLLGAIARTSLRHGAFWSVAGQGLPSVRRTLPELGSGDLQRALPAPRSDWLGDRLSLIGSKRGQQVLLSDATVSVDVQWRAGGVSRLMNQILRSARDLGGELFFEPAGQRLWARMQRRLEGFMNQLWAAGALYGATAADAYTVRCDSSSMTQADIDAGRVIATIAFTASQPIQQIIVTLALTQAGVGPSQEAA
ncbi:MAG TPA: phage tail sheath C-terminal domain-containing protein, partial [Caulobacteraceae bacterium]|nr:phage tail sheath C-terminal domain-containing protein [Caulobacteraceae bacterium]